MKKLKSEPLSHYVFKLRCPWGRTSGKVIIWNNYKINIVGKISKRARSSDG